MAAPLFFGIRVVLHFGPTNLADYQKPYLSIPEQINRLESRGMQISNQQKAERYLRHIGYYRMSAYWYPCREVDTSSGNPPHVRLDTFKTSTRFADIVDLYVFDKRLRLLFLDAIERIEVSLRTAIALEIGATSPWAHLDPKTYRKNFTSRQVSQSQSQFGKWKDKLSTQQAMSKESFVTHFSKKYPQSELPIWIAIELWDFGMLSKLLSGLDPKHSRAISSSYGVAQRPDLVPAWVRSLNIIRNFCAHHARLWNRISPFEVKSVQGDGVSSLDHLRRNDVDRKRTYAAAAVMQFLMKEINPDSSWSDRLSELVGTFPSTDHFKLSDAGFPDDWNTESLWKR